MSSYSEHSDSFQSDRTEVEDFEFSNFTMPELPFWDVFDADTFKMPAGYNGTFVQENTEYDYIENMDEFLKEKLDDLTRHKQSLGAFIVSVFNSKDMEVRKRVSNLYKGDHFLTIVDSIYTRAKKDDQERILGLLEQRYLDKIANELGKVEGLSVSSKSVSPEYCKSFSFDHILRCVGEKAPILLKMLNHIIPPSADEGQSSNTIVSTIASMVLNYRSTSNNYFQLMMGLYFYSKGVPRKVIEVFNRSRISASYSTVWRTLDSLRLKSMEIVKKTSESVPFYIVYDNINIRRVKYDQRLYNQDMFESGTTATLIVGKPLKDGLSENSYRKLCFDDLMISESSHVHFKNACKFHLKAVLKRFNSDITFRNPAPVIKVLPTVKSRVFPTTSPYIDQKTADGNSDVLEFLMKQVLQRPDSWFENGRLVIIGGDQLTISRLRTLHKYRADTKDAYEGLRWVVPVIQLFHLQMTLCSAILRNYFGDKLAPGSLAYFVEKLERKRISTDKLSFHDADEFIRLIFEATAIRAWDVILGDEGAEEMLSSDGLAQEIFIDEKVNVLHSTFLSGLALKKLSGRNASRNAALFLRDMIHYVELSSAIKTGDIGRIREVLRWLTIMLQAGSTKNYAYELLRLHCLLEYAASSEDGDSILSSMLVNTSGEKGRWIPADLYQEHNNLMIKVIYAAKGGNGSWDFLGQTISPNIEVFRSIAMKVEEEYRTYRNKKYHKCSSTSQDFRLSLLALGENSIFGAVPNLEIEGRSHTARDLFKEGIEKLRDPTRLSAFISKNMHLDSTPDEPLVRPNELEVSDDTNGVSIDVEDELDKYWGEFQPPRDNDQ